MLQANQKVTKLALIKELTQEIERLRAGLFSSAMSADQSLY